MRVAYHSTRTLMTLAGLEHFTLAVRQCRNATCSRFRLPYRPEAEGSLALPKAEIALDVIALVGTLRFAQHRSVPEIHRELLQRGISVSQRSVTNLIDRYEELLALAVSDPQRLSPRLCAQGQVILALDGLQPDVGHEVLWVLRDCLSGEILLARSLLSGREAELVGLLEELRTALPVPIRAVLSDGQHAIRNAVQTALPGVPHQLCQYRYLREAATPVHEADRHAKKELKKQVRGVRPIERGLEGRKDAEAEAVRGYCLAVRSALTDDGQPPLGAAGLQLHTRLATIEASIERVVEEKGLCPASSPASSTCSSVDERRPQAFGRRLSERMAGCTKRHTFWPIMSSRRRRRYRSPTGGWSRR
jgi:hypothetical protein